MEVKHPLAFLEKRDSSMTKTFITNLFIGLVAFAVISGIASVASAQETAGDPGVSAAPTRPEQQVAERDEKQAEVQTLRDEKKEELDARREAMASNTEAMRAKIEEQRENMASRTEAIREKIEERKTVINERIKNRILALADNVSRKMRAAVGRLNQIIGRFETRVALLEERGIDGSDATAKLAEAKSYLATASNILENEINAAVDATVGSDTPRESWMNARAQFSEARIAIRNAHQALREALALLKRAVAEAEESSGVSDVVRKDTLIPIDDSQATTSNLPTENTNE